MAKQSQKPVGCSFCGKDKTQNVHLIAGPDGIWICNECVALCVEILEDEPPRPSMIQECTLVLEDGSRHVVLGGLRETVLSLGRDDESLVAFQLAEGGRLAVRRQAVRQLRAETEPPPPLRELPDWASSQD